MSTELEKEVPTIDTAAQGVEIRQTYAGDIAFINTQLVTPKTIDIMIMAIESMRDQINSGHGIYSVVFRTDGYPKVNKKTLTSWMFFPDSKCAVCNIDDCIKMAFNTTQDEKTEFGANLSVFAGVWKNIITGFFHEAHHAESYIHNRDGLESGAKARKIEEDQADRFAREQLFYVAKHMDIEIEFSPVVASMINTTLKEDIELINSDKDISDHLKNWATYQKYMKDEGGSFFDPADEDSDEENYLVKTFKEFCHYASGDETDDPEWNMAHTMSKTVEIEADIAPLNVATNGTVATQSSGQEVSSAIGVPFDAEDMFVEDVEDSDKGLPFTPDTIITPIIATNPPVAPVVMATTVPVAPIQAAPVAPIVGTTQALMAEKMYEPVPLDPNQFQATVKSLYLKIFEHIFQTCGYNPATNPFFNQPAKIADQLPLNSHEALIAKEMSCYNAQGQIVNGTLINNWISGKFMDKAKTLPGFELTLSMPDGVQIMRKFIPQNPWKKRISDQQYSSTALEAQQGAQILWVINPNAVDKQFATRVHNGALQSNDSGSWTNV